MRRSPLVLLLLALASGAVAAYLALGFLRDRSVPILAAERPTNQVVLTARDVQIGALLQERDVRLVEWPGEAVPPGFARTREEVIGRAVLTPMKLNEPILESKLAPLGAGGGYPMLIKEGMRALAVRVDDVVGVSGFVWRGTRVDILLTMPSPRTNEPTTQVILQNIEALSSGATYTVNEAGNAMPAPVVTVLVTPEQAETLVLASSQGKIQMALRNTLDTAAISTAGTRSSVLFPGNRTISTNTTGRRQIVRPPPPRQTIIEGFRGGEKTLTRFNNSGRGAGGPPPPPPPAPPPSEEPA